MKRIPANALPGFKETDVDVSVGFGVHLSEIDGSDYVVNDSHGLMVGLMAHDHGDVIALTQYRRAKTRPFGMGMMHTLSVECARDTAAALIELADRLEASATEQAQAALRKAAGR
ncbi:MULTISPECIES: hypothetical protein [unclassified Sphingomonas]|uniref:hypothetical protein n=1 Tax=unclassified Sphingomonas TaxID=196159 RepID=UPI000701AD16|nr:MULTISPECIES: hypothetical protein [unclassified Sphingomonas]KQM60083.1 hypothetical protein ASE65_10275 [Sphingomonas sp. Leaf16]KQN11481.1 hypothetical protein ASE81_11260 [Sphingomonas sp. Leaf29]KQN18803.1 hypothetical protein ASE83_11200 [Sphingomonas sp. Leaf32]